MTNRYSAIELPVLMGLTLAALILSGVAPFDRTTWWVEIAPSLILLPVLLVTGRRFPLTRLVYRLLFPHGLILMLGGHYTHARGPLGFWVQELFDLSRNHYDRLGHPAQGFIPALLVREVLLKKLCPAPGALAVSHRQQHLPGLQRLL